MFRFFRRIRKRLFGEGRIARYAAYAIGEILLVVIGILIALQIDNWNEGRKLQAQEYKLLYNLQKDLEASRQQLDYFAESNEQYALSIDTLIQNMNDPGLDTAGISIRLLTLRHWTSPYLPTTAYEVIKNQGIELIRNDSLREAIIRFYEYDMAFLIGDYDREEWVYAESVSYPTITRLLRKESHAYGSEGSISIPGGIDGLREDVQFRNMLGELYYLRTKGVFCANRMNTFLDRIINGINRELAING